MGFGDRPKVCITDGRRSWAWQRKASPPTIGIMIPGVRPTATKAAFLMVGRYSVHLRGDGTLDIGGSSSEYCLS